MTVISGIILRRNSCKCLLYFIYGPPSTLEAEVYTSKYVVSNGGLYVETDEFEQTKKVGISAADWGEQGEQTRHI